RDAGDAHLRRQQELHDHADRSRSAEPGQEVAAVPAPAQSLSILSNGGARNCAPRFFVLGKSSGRKRTRVPSAAVEPPAREPAPAALLLSSIVAGLIAIVFIIYAQVRTHGFINFDDPEYVSANPHVLAGLTWDGVRWAFTHIHAAYWIPVTWISHM